MPQRRFSLFDLFLFVAFCSLLLAFLVPIIQNATSEGSGAHWAQGLAFSADGSTVAALFGDGKVRVWRADNDQSLVATFDSGANFMGGWIAVSSDGTLAAVFTEGDSTSVQAVEVEIWNIGTAQRIASLTGVEDASFAFSPREALLAVGNQDFSVDLYRCVPNGPPAHLRKLAASDKAVSHSDQCPALAFSSDGKTLATPSPSAVWFWDVETGETRGSLEINHTVTDAQIQLSGDGRYLAICGFHYRQPKPRFELEVWDLPASRKLPALPRSSDADGVISGNNSRLFLPRHFNSLAFLPDRRTLVSTGCELCAWDVEAGGMRAIHGDIDKSAVLIATPLRGSRFAVADFQKIILWDAETLEPREVLWTPSAGEPSTTLIAAAMVLFMVWAVRRAKKHSRQCATCGQSYYLANAKDSQTECPACRPHQISATVRKATGERSP